VVSRPDVRDRAGWRLAAAGAGQRRLCPVPLRRESRDGGAPSPRAGLNRRRMRRLPHAGDDLHGHRPAP
jgi:hypothetical protein